MIGTVPNEELEECITPADAVDDIADEGNVGNKVDDGVANSVMTVAGLVIFTVVKVALLVVDNVFDVAMVVVVVAVVVVTVVVEAADDNDDAFDVVVAAVDNDADVVSVVLVNDDDGDEVVVNVVVDSVEEGVTDDDVDEDTLENVVGVVAGGDDEVDALELVTFEPNVVMLSDDVVDMLAVNTELFEYVSSSTVVELKDPLEFGEAVNADSSAVVMRSSTLRRTM
jgi:hypothetical protein